MTTTSDAAQEGSDPNGIDGDELARMAEQELNGEYAPATASSVDAAQYQQPAQLHLPPRIESNFLAQREATPDQERYLPYIRLGNKESDRDLFRKLGLDEDRGRALKQQVQEVLRHEPLVVFPTAREQKLDAMQRAVDLLDVRGLGNRYLARPSGDDNILRVAWPDQSTELILTFIPLVYKVLKADALKRKNQVKQAVADAAKLQPSAAPCSGPATFASPHLLEHEQIGITAAHDNQPIQQHGAEQGTAQTPCVCPCNCGTRKRKRDEDDPLFVESTRLPPNAQLSFKVWYIKGLEEVLRYNQREKLEPSQIPHYKHIMAPCKKNNVVGTVRVVTSSGVILVDSEETWMLAVCTTYHDPVMERIIKVRVEVHDPIVLGD